MIRTLKAEEIECRVQQVTEKGYILLLYKDARVDQRILDEVFGMFGWEREHQIIDGQLFCTVRIWDKENSRWVSKQDVGTESMTEKEKGRASDSFKRACFNIGIGRELYSSPFIWVNAGTGETYNRNGKLSLDNKVKFSVKEIGYDENREINQLTIVDQKGTVRYKLGQHVQQQAQQATHTQTNNTTITAKEAGQHVLTFGKNKGKTLKDVFKNDQTSWKWLVDNATGETKKCVELMIAAIQG